VVREEALLDYIFLYCRRQEARPCACALDSAISDNL
jgi:hypothetical protein